MMPSALPGASASTDPTVTRPVTRADAPVARSAAPAAAIPAGTGTSVGSVAPGASETRGNGIDAAPGIVPASAVASVAPPVRAAPEPAGRVFAAAMHLAASSDDRRSRPESAAAILSTTAPDFSRDPATTAPAPAIDLTDGRWPARMLDRIEALRDDADAASTRVRFAPDALGPVEVHVRREGGATHLHFTAAQADTRALLQAAQPDLARMASERGVKLGQSSVGSDAQPQRQPPAPARFAAPRRATPEATDADTDTRIA